MTKNKTSKKAGYAFECYYTDGRVDILRANSEKRAKVLRTSIKYKNPLLITPIRKSGSRDNCIPMGIVAVVKVGKSYVPTARD